MDYLFLIAGLAFLGVYLIVFRAIGSKPGAKNLARAVRERSIKDVGRVLLTQRLFSFSDFGLDRRDLSAREIIFVVALVIVMVLAVTFF
jgi:hypothetical protein